MQLSNSISCLLLFVWPSVYHGFMLPPYLHQLPPPNFLDFDGRKSFVFEFLFLPRLLGEAMDGETEEIVFVLLNLPMFQKEKGSSG